MNRLDKEMVARKLVESRTKAQELVLDNAVEVNCKIQTKPSFAVEENDEIKIVKTDVLKYVSRGGLKLEKAIKVFDIDMKDKIVLDIGSSTGGFTDCSIQNGAKKVFAIDVGTDVMHKSLRNDSRIELYENTNITDVAHEIFEQVDLAVVDVSFVGLEKIVEKVASEQVEIDMICLIKPQFECGKAVAAKYNGIIKSKSIHKEVLNKVIKTFDKCGFGLLGLDFSPITGGDGNIEYISHFSNRSKNSIKVVVEDVVNKAFKNHEK